MTFKPLDYLENAVKNKDIKDIRLSISCYINKCLGDTDEIIDAINYIKNELTEEEYNSIWEEYDGLKLDSNKDNWNKSYFSLLKVELTDNFAKERFDHILEVGKYVYGETKPLEPKDERQTLKINDNLNSTNDSQKKRILPLVLVGGVVLLLGAGILVKLLKK